MSKISVYNLSNLVPTIFLKNDEQNILQNAITNNAILTLESPIDKSTVDEQIYLDIQINENEENETLEWLDKRKRLGDHGEEIAFKYLITKYRNVKNVANQAFHGFDIEVKDNDVTYGFEVKTSKHNDGFFITYNELVTASKLQDRYNIFLVHIKDEENVVGYIINNPIAYFGIRLDKIMSPIDIHLAFITPNSFYIKLKPMLLEKVFQILLSEFK